MITLETIQSAEYKSLIGSGINGIVFLVKSLSRNDFCIKLTRVHAYDWNVETKMMKLLQENNIRHTNKLLYDFQCKRGDIETQDEYEANSLTITNGVANKKRFYSLNYNEAKEEAVHVLVQEYADKGTLLDCVRSLNTLNDDTINTLSVLSFQLLFTLRQIHCSLDDFCHNDLKLDNILLFSTKMDDSSVFYKYSDDEVYELPNIGMEVRIADFDFSCTRTIRNNKALISTGMSGVRYTNGQFADYFKVLYGLYCALPNWETELIGDIKHFLRLTYLKGYNSCDEAYECYLPNDNGGYRNDIDIMFELPYFQKYRVNTPKENYTPYVDIKTKSKYEAMKTHISQFNHRSTESLSIVVPKRVIDLDIDINLVWGYCYALGIYQDGTQQYKIKFVTKLLNEFKKKYCLLSNQDISLINCSEWLLVFCIKCYFEDHSSYGHNCLGDLFEYARVRTYSFNQPTYWNLFCQAYWLI